MAEEMIYIREKKTIFSASLIAAIFVLTIYLFMNNLNYENEKGNFVNANTSDIFKDPKFFCFTRFLINVPDYENIIYGRMTAGGEFSRLKERASNINNLIEEEINLNSRNHNLYFTGAEFDKLAGQAISTSSPHITHLLSIIGSEEYSVHTYLQLGADAYVISALGVRANFVRSVIAEHFKSALHLERRSEGEIPSQPGICIDGAISTNETAYEGIEFGVRLKKFSDVHFSVQVIKNGDEAQPVDLLSDFKESIEEGRESGLGRWINQVKILRQGKRIVSEWQGEEMLLRIPSGFGKPSFHQFMFRASGKGNDSLHPFVEITLDTGVKGNQTASVEPSLSDEEALALWDWLLNSIRVRPNAVAAKASALARPGA